MSFPELIVAPTERALSPTHIDLADFTANPYKGCGVGCVYCYARSNRSLQKLKKEWGSFVVVKEGFVSKLNEELAGKTDIRRVLIGSVTEPFQDAEKTYHLTRDTLELLRSRNIPFVLLTKSPIAAEFSGLMGYSPMNRVYMTVNSEEARELFEKNSAPQKDRVEAVRALARAGVRTVVYISPVFPGLTDMNELTEILLTLDARNVEFRAESYNPKMGNWKELRELLPERLKAEYDGIFSGKITYESFWNELRGRTEDHFSSRGLSLTFRVGPFDSWYAPGDEHGSFYS